MLNSNLRFAKYDIKMQNDAYTMKPSATAHFDAEMIEQALNFLGGGVHFVKKCDDLSEAISDCPLD